MKSQIRKLEENTLPSMTIPDMALSVSEIQRRFLLGTLPTDLVRDVLYNESDDFDEALDSCIDGYDLVDKQRELLRLRIKFEALRNKNVAASTPPASEDNVTSVQDDSPD
ncbi:hypothetical protein [Peromfec virus RodF5_15]|uniref:Uncharacterized protein n=1 Tax=Peromfec virus RodF5_15 TaxID=2929337 RepID=A0A976R8V6_9VIRU|nr:hypothetical protein [Peromfec virus RodF5_15]